MMKWIVLQDGGGLINTDHLRSVSVSYIDGTHGWALRARDDSTWFNVWYGSDYVSKEVARAKLQRFTNILADHNETIIYTESL